MRRGIILRDKAGECGETAPETFAENRKNKMNSVNYYETNAETFAASTLGADVSALYAEFEKYLEPGCRIMDLGSGSGRDSRYFAGKGYSVAAADPSPAMCRKTRETAGVPTYTMRAEDLIFEDEFDAVWACASLLHVAREDQASVLKKIARALRGNGIAYCSWKYGTEDRAENGRCFTDLEEEGLARILAKVPEFSLIKTWVTSDVRPDRAEQRWLNALLRKDGVSF